LLMKQAFWTTILLPRAMPQLHLRRLLLRQVSDWDSYSSFSLKLMKLFIMKQAALLTTAQLLLRVVTTRLRVLVVLVSVWNISSTIWVQTKAMALLTISFYLADKFKKLMKHMSTKEKAAMLESFFGSMGGSSGKKAKKSKK
jgi:hypothetical protein